MRLAPQNFVDISQCIHKDYKWRNADLNAGNTKRPLFPYYYWDYSNKRLRAFNRALFYAGLI